MSESVIDRRCTLLVPGLLDLPVTEYESVFAQAGPLPELECFFSHAQKQELPGVGLHATTFSLFDVDVPNDVDLPVAAAAYVGETEKKETAWRLCADPVQLIPDRDQLVLIGPESLSLTQAEADKLAAELNAQFAQDGWLIEACAPTRWYLSSANKSKLRTYSLAQVRGQSINDYLPRGADGKQWHRLMNEIQMVLHSSEVNQQRQINGQPLISSLWFWGGGKAPEVKHSQWNNICSDEPVSLGLAALSNTPRMPCPQGGAAWLSANNSPGKHLLVLGGLFDCWQRGESEAWIQQARALEQNWFLPLISALRNRKISELAVCVCNGTKFTLSRAGLKRWWHRKKSLATFVAQNKN